MGLDTVELIVNIENHFDIYIPDPEAEKINTVQQLVDCVQGIIALQSDQKLSKEDVERMVIRIVSESCGIAIDKIKLSHSITFDLGLD